MLLILEAVTVMTVAMDIALQLSMLRVPVAWYSAFRPHPTPVGHFVSSEPLAPSAFV